MMSGFLGRAGILYVVSVLAISALGASSRPRRGWRAPVLGVAELLATGAAACWIWHPRWNGRSILALAWEQILAAAAEMGADLVVVGTHGRRGLAHVILGSVAERVVQLSPVPVLTVRGRAGAAS
jgi:hypothetical protein